MPIQKHCNGSRDVVRFYRNLMKGGQMADIVGKPFIVRTVAGEVEELGTITKQQIAGDTLFLAVKIEHEGTLRALASSD